MFTNKEVRDYSNLLQNLNQQDDRPLPEGYAIVKGGGGKDGIPHYKLIENEIIREYVLWVRGTDFCDPNDLKINMQTSPIKFYNGTCHKGYYNAARKVIDEVRDYFTRPELNQLVCMGHSLGGAVSSIITTIFNKGDYGDFIQGMNSLKERFSGGVRGIVFGTPPLFSPNISKETNQYITNIILKKDVIPKLGNTFNSITKFQLRLVSLLLYQINGLYQRPTKKKIAKKYQAETNKHVFADELPGNVIIVNSKGERFEKGGNPRKIHKTTDWFGIVQHFFTNYHHVISNCVEEDDNAFLGNTRNKNSKNWWPVLKNSIHYNIVIPYRYSNHVFKAFKKSLVYKKNIFHAIDEEFDEEVSYCEKKIFKYCNIK